MKKLLLAAAMLLCTALATKAQTVIDNQTNCNIMVIQICYNAACIPVSTAAHPVPANTNYTIPIPCPAGYITVYNVCWDEPGCMGTCATVEGSPYAGCGGGLYNVPLPPCVPCSPGGAIVDYDLVNDVLTIF